MGGDCLPGQIDPVKSYEGRQSNVYMRIDESGHERPALQIHHPCACRMKLKYFLAIAQSDDAAVSYRQGLNLGQVVTDCKNGTAKKDRLEWSISSRCLRIIVYLPIIPTYLSPPGLITLRGIAICTGSVFWEPTHSHPRLEQHNRGSPRDLVLLQDRG